MIKIITVNQKHTIVKKWGVCMKKMLNEIQNFQKIGQKLEKLNNESQKRGLFSGFHSG